MKQIFNEENHFIKFQLSTMITAEEFSKTHSKDFFKEDKTAFKQPKISSFLTSILSSMHKKNFSDSPAEALNFNCI
jgi:hypothetical protein